MQPAPEQRPMRKSLKCGYSHRKYFNEPFRGATLQLGACK